jgi:hypothetical protein
MSQKRRHYTGLRRVAPVAGAAPLHTIDPAELARSSYPSDNIFFMPWVLLSLVVGGVAAALLVVRSRTAKNRPDVGSVSGQWIASHRADSSDH